MSSLERLRRVPGGSDALPPGLSSMWRLCRLGFHYEPTLMGTAFLLALAAALPDALLAVWFKLLGEGLLEHNSGLLRFAVVALAVSVVATWLLQTVSTRIQRRFRDKVTIALESHVARLQATIGTIAHQERPEYLDRLSVLRDQIFTLDHMYMSVFSTAGWILRLAVTVALLATVNPVLILLVLFAIPTVAATSWRPVVERTAQERGAQADRLARHLFTLSTTASPGKERPALDDVDLFLPAGSVVAVVGENGAGKTTLVKLLAKLYAPSAGRILVDGADLARVDSARWRDRLAGAFQDFFRFEFLAGQTIGVGDLPRLDVEPAVVAATDRAGARDLVDNLPAGLRTQLGPTWADGVDVSYGQWQKLALARGFMRDEPLLVALDEPTAALDAETEHQLFERYATRAREARRSGSVTILVSHRFSTVRMADLIVVLDGARVAETGSHDELLARGGRYAELYQIQARAYQ
jgi:ABC-type multidrug transport system fused ATPase/permease subunit